MGGWEGKGRKERLQPSATEDLVKVLPPKEGCFSKHSHFSQKDPCLFYKQILQGFFIGQTEPRACMPFSPVNSRSKDGSLRSGCCEDCKKVKSQPRALVTSVPREALTFHSQDWQQMLSGGRGGRKNDFGNSCFLFTSH